MLASSLFANNPFDVGNIPAELLENAHTVTRLDESTCEIESYDKMRVKIHKVITLLSEKASYASEVDVYYTEEIDKISGLKIHIYDALGKLVKKIKKKDISDVAVYDGSMASDSRALTYKSTYSKYPYTIEYEYEIESRYTAFIPRWFPYESFQNSVEYSRFKVTVPKGFEIRFLNRNHESFQNEIKIDSKNLLFEAKGLKSIKSESMMPYSNLPYTRFSPSKSILDKTEVSYTDWNSFGMWMYTSYLKDKNDLNVTTISEVEELVSGLDNDYDKAKAVYDHAVNSTRYISIQLGEGGWEPFYAEETHGRKYGDCKALSIYTLSMMEKVGLNPFYVIIYGKSAYRMDLEEEFASIQGNHAIIGVPINGDTIYADCTSSYNPFGYKSGFTDGRIALAVNESGGKVVTTHKYEDTENQEHILSAIHIDPASRMVRVMVDNTLEGLQIEDRLSISQYTNEQIKEKVFPYFYPEFSKEKFEDISYSLVDEKTVVEQFEIESQNFISVAGDYLILPLHLHSIGLQVLDSEERKLPIYIKNGYVKKYSYSVEIPDGYAAVQLPESVRLKSAFGEWILEIQESQDSVLKYTISQFVKSGTFAQDMVEEYNNWLQEIENHSMNKLTFKNKKK